MIARPQSVENPTPLWMREQPGPKQVLYVEDNDALRRLGHRILTQVGYEVTTAANGLEGWTALLSAPFHLMVTDIDMPLLSGTQLIAKARHSGLLIPCIITTGSRPDLNSGELHRLQIAAVVNKPFSLDELVGAARKVLEGNVPPLHQPPIAPWLPPLSPHRLPAIPRWGINE